MKRAEEMQKDRPELPSFGRPTVDTNGRPERNGKIRERPKRESSAPDFEPGTEGHKRQIVEMAFMGVMGMKREKAEALYEKQLQEWRDSQQAKTE